MVRTGKVVGNLMIGVNPSNVKLRDRAARIVGELSKADPATVTAAVEKSGRLVNKAYKRLRQERRRGAKVVGRGLKK